jgi:hypothetical protein
MIARHQVFGPQAKRYTPSPQRIQVCTDDYSKSASRKIDGLYANCRCNPGILFEPRERDPRVGDVASDWLRRLRVDVCGVLHNHHENECEQDPRAVNMPRAMPAPGLFFHRAGV